MHASRALPALLLLATVVACNGDDTGGESETGTTAATSSATDPASASATAATASASASATATGTASATGTTDATTTDNTTTNTTTTNPTATDATTAMTTAATTSESTSTTDASTTAVSTSDATTDATTDGMKLDMGMQGCVPDQTPKTFDFIWIANTTQNTVSKIDTKTGVEVGRFLVGPGQTNASRTSVNQFGDVVVSSRHEGRVTKVAALEIRCNDNNNNGVIDTSTGPNDIKPWGQDECVVWNTPVPSPDYSHGPRATAWEGVIQDPETCEMPVPRVWIGYKDGGENGHFLRLDGESGAILDDVVYNGWGTSFSPYGGAVNSEGDFIVIGYDSGKVVQVDSETLQITDLGQPPGGQRYGMGVAGNGDVWIGSYNLNNGMYHYDVNQGSWSGLGPAGGYLAGVQIDEMGRVWGAGYGPCRLVHADSFTNQYVNTNIALPGCSTPWGVSIDNEGYVWVVDKGNKAFKVDPDTYQVELVVTGLVNPYTYSDMTGQGLQLVIPQ